MRTVGVVAALTIALLVQTMLAGMSIAGSTVVNLVLVAVVYVALAYGAATGLLAGAAGGLLQDALAGGIVGIGSLPKTIVGFMVGVLGAQFIVSQPVPRFVMFIGATVVHEFCFQALYALVESRPFLMHYPATLTQAVVNGAIGLIAFQLVDWGPGLMQRRESRRAAFSSRRRF